jgi:bifunctional non-homologous end joining protein LigD
VSPAGRRKGRARADADAAAGKAGHGVRITHPEKLLFPADGITKGEVAAYYEAVAPLIVPHIRARPLTMERFPAGIEEEGFFQKSVTRGFPAWLERVEVPKKGGSVHYPLVLDDAALMWTVNQNCITHHVWTSRVPELDRPDLCVFDLDPMEDEPAVVRAAALALRDLLGELGLRCWIKTTGSKGFHIVVPVTDADTGRVWRFADRVAHTLLARDPDHLTLEFSKADRGGRILIDTGRNGFGATFAAAYTVRPKPGAPVSAPCTWPEIERGDIGPRTFGLRDMAARIAAVGDLWADIPAHAVALDGAIEALRG